MTVSWVPGSRVPPELALSLSKGSPFFWANLGASPAPRDGRRKPSDLSLGKVNDKTHSTLPKACA